MTVDQTDAKALGLSEAQLAEYGKLFEAAVHHPRCQTKQQMESGLAHKESILQLLPRVKGVEKEELKNVVQMCDKQKRNAFDRNDWLLFMRLLTMAQMNKPLSLDPHSGPLLPWLRLHGIQFPGQEQLDFDNEEDDRSDEELVDATDDDTDLLDRVLDLKENEQTVRKRLGKKTSEPKGNKQKKREKPSKKNYKKKSEKSDDDLDFSDLDDKDQDSDNAQKKVDEAGSTWFTLRNAIYLLLFVVCMWGLAILRFSDEEYEGMDMTMQQPIKDPYDVLGCDRKDSQAEIKKRYRNLALQWHPDKNPNCGDWCEKKLSEINDAWRLIGSKESRRAFDATGGGAFENLPSDAISLNSENFDKLVTNSDDIWIIQVYSEWHRSCKLFAPAWEDVIRKVLPSPTSLTAIGEIHFLTADVCSNVYLHTNPYIFLAM